MWTNLKVKGIVKEGCAVGSRGQDARQRRGENQRMEYNCKHDAGIVHIGSQRVEED